MAVPLAQWVGESDWRFKATFQITKEQVKQDNVDIVFEGLDTFCHVEIVRAASRRYELAGWLRN